MGIDGRCYSGLAFVILYNRLSEIDKKNISKIQKTTQSNNNSTDLFDRSGLNSFEESGYSIVWGDTPNWIQNWNGRRPLILTKDNLHLPKNDKKYNNPSYEEYLVRYGEIDPEDEEIIKSAFNYVIQRFGLDNKEQQILKNILFDKTKTFFGIWFYYTID